VLPPQFREHVPPPAPERAQNGIARDIGARKKWLAVIIVGLVLGVAAALGLGLVIVGDEQEPLTQTAQPLNLTDQARASLTPSSPTANRIPPSPTAAAATAVPTAATTAPERSEQIIQDAWVINCVNSGAKKTCFAVLQVLERENRRVVFAWVLGLTPDGAPAVLFQTPPGVQLQQGIEFKLGNAAPRTAPYVMCNSRACEASAPMDDRMIREAMAALNGNAVATVTIADGRVVNFTMPIKGIDKVLAAIRG
jgi:invasion protein IalB